MKPSSPSPTSTAPIAAAQGSGAASNRSTPPACRLPAESFDFATGMLLNVARDSVQLAKDFLAAGETEHARLQIDNALTALDQLAPATETAIEL